MSSLESFSFEASASLESPLSAALPPAKVPKLEISSSESTSSDGSPPAKVLKLDFSSPESMSSEGPPLKGKALMHEVGIETDSKMLTDHSSVTLDSDDEDGNEREFSDSEMGVYYDALEASGGFDAPLMPNSHACSMITPVIPFGDCNRQQLKRLCIAAIDHFNENEHKKYELVKLVKANNQAARGIRYFLTLEAYNP